MTVPVEITNLAAQYLSGHSDGYEKEAAGKQLDEIREYIHGALNGKCSQCERNLAVTQRLDHATITGNLMCIPCARHSVPNGSITYKEFVACIKRGQEARREGRMETPAPRSHPCLVRGIVLTEWDLFSGSYIRREGE